MRHSSLVLVMVLVIHGGYLSDNYAKWESATCPNKKLGDDMYRIRWVHASANQHPPVQMRRDPPASESAGSGH